MFVEIRKKRPVVEYLLSDDLANSVALFLKKEGLNQEREGEMYTLLDAVMRDEVALGDIAALLSKAFGLTEEQSVRGAQGFIGYLLLPLELYVPAVRTALNGVDTSAFPTMRVQKTIMDPTTAIQNILSQRGISLPEELFGRLVYLTKGYLKGERDREATKRLLMQGANVGGLALPDVAADQLLIELDKIMGTSTISSTPIAVRAGAGPTTIDEDNSLAPQESPAPVVPAPVDVKSEIDELQKVKELPPLEPMEPLVVPQPKPASSAVTRSALSQTAVRALAASVPIVSGELMTKAEHAEIEQHKAPAQKAQKQTAPQDQKVSADAAKITDAWWAQVKPSTITKTALGQLVDTALRGIRSMNALEGTLRDTYKIDFAQIEVLSGLIMQTLVERDLALITTQEETERKEAMAQEKRRADEKKKSDPAPVAPPVAKAEVSAPTVHKSVHGEQKVTDIIYKKQTLGPVDELGSMTIGDFRLLASRPQDLPDAVLAKIAVIAEDGYEERLKAVQAWKQSPVYLMYVRLLRDAIKLQKAIPEVITEVRAKGEEVLSPAEVDAVMAINKKLQ